MSLNACIRDTYASFFVDVELLQCRMKQRYSDVKEKE